MALLLADKTFFEQQLTDVLYGNCSILIHHLPLKSGSGIVAQIAGISLIQFIDILI